MNYKKIAMVSALVLIIPGAVLGTGVYLGKLNKDSILQQSSEERAANEQTVAFVNGEKVGILEIAPFVNQGLDRAVAIDRYINKVLTAQMAEGEYGEQATQALKAAEREILSNLYIRNKTEELEKSISDKEIKDFYESNVKAEDYAQYKINFYLTQDFNDARLVQDAAKKGQQDAVKKFEPLIKDEAGKEQFAPAFSLPYDLGNVVKTLKKGEYTQPLVLRNGIFIFQVTDIKEGEVPTLEQTTGQIKNILVQRKLNNILLEERKNAQIKLNG